MYPRQMLLSQASLILTQMVLMSQKFFTEQTLYVKFKAFKWFSPMKAYFNTAGHQRELDQDKSACGKINLFRYAEREREIGMQRERLEWREKERDSRLERGRV